MQIRFTLNVVDVLANEGETIVTTDEHYRLAAEQFKEDFKDCDHELYLKEQDLLIVYEMQDIDVVCDICHTYPCKCE